MSEAEYVTLQEVPSIADDEWWSHQHGNGTLGELGGWQRIDLAADEFSEPPSPPALLGLIYEAKRHVISGPPESAKTLIAYLLLLEALRSGRPVAIIDFEMGAYAARQLLTDLGGTLDEIRSIYYVSPDSAPPDEMQAIVKHGTWLCLIDAAIGAYDASGLDDNARKDVQRFARTWIDPLWKADVASLLVDHVTKNTETRGKFTIGSERKLGAADVHLSAEAVKTLSRGDSGIVKIHVHKDRAGYLKRPVATVFDLSSHPETHRLEWQQRDPHPTDAQGGFRPTHLMEKVSRYLQDNGPSSQNQVGNGVKGKAEWVRAALERLVIEGHATESEGARGARIFTSAKVFLEAQDDFVPPRPDLVPDEVQSPRPTSSPPTGGRDEDDVAKDEVTSSRFQTTVPDDDIPF